MTTRALASPEELADSRPWSEFWSGVRAELPIMPADLPFGVVYGASAVAAGFSPVLAVASSAIICAGSAQLIGVRLVGAGAPAALVVATTFIVNLRHVLYGASLAPNLRPLSKPWKWLLAYMLTDEAFAVVATRSREEAQAPHAHWFFLGAGAALWTSWLASTALGVLLGAQIPAWLSLDFAAVLTFIGLAVPLLTDRGSIAAAAAAAAVALLAHALPLKLGLVVAALAGVVAGTLADRKRS